MPKFQIGDPAQVQPNKEHCVTSGWQTGVITSMGRSNPDRYIIRWDQEQPDEVISDFGNRSTDRKKLKNYYEFLEHALELFNPDPAENARTPVERRIRKLWNNSNWVNTDKQRAY